jgi:hypothetical protein
MVLLSARFVNGDSAEALAADKSPLPLGKPVKAVPFNSGAS